MSLLCIQIPYTEERLHEFISLSQEFVRQSEKHGLDDLIVLQWDDTGKEMSIGEKREILYKKSPSLYTVQWDSDDWVSPDGLMLMIQAIKDCNVDCVTYQEHISIDGKIEKSNHSLLYHDWEGEGGKELWDGFHYHRTPFMKSVIKTEIAQSVPIPHARFGEDHQWSQALKPHLRSEAHIEQDIYFYQHISTPHTQRYGFDKD